MAHKANPIKPLTFTLEPRQIARIRAWVNKEIGAERVSEGYEEDCACTSPFTYEFTPSGICTITKVRGFGKVLDVTIDDDNHMESEHE